jgi:hypothetical protein
VNFIKKLPKIIRQACTFFVVTILWIFFRSATSHQAFIIIIKIFTFQKDFLLEQNLQLLLQTTNLSFYSIGLIISLLILFCGIDFLKLNTKIIHRNTSVFPSLPELVIINVIILLLILFGDWGGERFIYFQF